MGAEDANVGDRAVSNFDPSSLTPGATQVLVAIMRLSTSGADFSSDDVRNQLDARQTTVNPNDVGNGFRHAQHVAKIIVRVGARPSLRPGAHRRRVGVYRAVGAVSAVEDKKTEQTVLVG